MKNYFLTAALACSFFSCAEDADLVTNELNESVDQIKIKESMKKNAEKEIIFKNIPDMKQQNFIPETTNMQLDNQSIINSDVKANIIKKYQKFKN